MEKEEVKHHKVKGVWRHRPDSLPLVDAPSMGPKRKKGPLEKASKKHLWDLLKQAKKELLGHAERMLIRGVPTKVEHGPFWLSASCDMCDWGAVVIIKQADKMDEIIRELERRME